MASPCYHAVKMHSFGTKTHHQRSVGPTALKNFHNFAPATHFSDKFLPRIYHLALTVSSEKLWLVTTLNVKS